jgi:hypothetical protein
MNKILKFPGVEDMNIFDNMCNTLGQHKGELTIRSDSNWPKGTYYFWCLPDGMVFVKKPDTTESVMFTIPAEVITAITPLVQMT